MNYFLLIPFFAAGVNLTLALFVFTRDWRLRINQVFLLWGASLSLWNFGAFMLFNVRDTTDALAWARVTHMGVIFIPISVLHLSALLTRRVLGEWLYIGYCATLVLACFNFTEYFIPGVTNIGYAWFAQPGPLYWVFLIIFTMMTYPSLYLIWRAINEPSYDGSKRLNTLLIADCLLLVFGSHDLLPVMGFRNYPLTDIPVYPWGQFAACLYGLLVGYSVMHDQLLDIRVSIGRQAATLIRLFFVFSISFFLLVVASFVASERLTISAFTIALVVSVVSAFLAGVFFPRLLGGNTELIERRILGDRFEHQAQLRAFSARILEYKEIPRLLDDTLRQLIDVMNLAGAHLIVLDPKTQEPKFVVGDPPVHPNLIPDFAGGSPLADFFRSGATFLDFRNPQNGMYLGRNERDSRAAIRALDPEFVLPIKRGGALLGLMLLGKKKNRLPLTRVDLEISEDIANAIGMAVDRLGLSEKTALLEKFELLAVMSAGLAHDLRNRLQPILTYLQLHSGRYEAGTAENDLFRIALGNAEAIRSYVQAALFFSEKMKPCFETVFTNDLLSAAAGLPSIRPNRHRCTVIVTDNAKCSVYCDRVMMRRIIDNLVVNALDASTDGQAVVIKAEVLPETSTRVRWLRIIVTDQGCGIPAEDVGRVFEPYFSTKVHGDQNRGFGLGLSVVQRLVFLHGGTVTISSNVGSGTSVIVEIPTSQTKAVSQ